MLLPKLVAFHILICQTQADTLEIKGTRKNGFYSIGILKMIFESCVNQLTSINHTPHYPDHKVTPAYRSTKKANKSERPVFQ